MQCIGNSLEDTAFDDGAHGGVHACAISSRCEDSDLHGGGQLV